MANELILDGGCLCGAVRYRATAVPTKSSYCHCRMCQRSAGSPVLAWAGVPASTFAYVAGEPRIYRSSARAQREFCPTCGTQLVIRDDGAIDIDITIASLDEPARLPPRYHIWRMSRIEWFETADSLPRHNADREER
jgi:hypothetical protein